MLYFFLHDPIGSMGPLWGTFAAHNLGVPVWLDLLCLFLYLLVPYLLGSLNSAVIVSKLLYHDDIRKYGSGNAGFTNVMRTYGAKAAGITLAGDILKTVVSVMFGWCLHGYVAAYFAGFACFIGHILPCFYQFRGGKGVLCAASMVMMLDWRLFLLLMGIFFLAVAVTKYISFGSILSAMVFPIALQRMNRIGIHMIVLVATAMAVIIVYKHRQNLKRIFSGTESKFSFKRSQKTGPAEEKTAGEGNAASGRDEAGGKKGAD